MNSQMNAIEWLVAAEPGEQFVYYTGFLWTQTKRPPIAMWFWDRCQEGVVTLVQRRLNSMSEPGVFEYIAIKLRRK